jgi:hypothetical protein
VGETASFDGDPPIPLWESHHQSRPIGNSTLLVRTGIMIGIQRGPAGGINLRRSYNHRSHE